MTLNDVAKEANVAVSTVSNVLNGLTIVAPETRARVLDAIQKLGYVPNINGRNLKARATKKIGLFVLSMKGEFFSVLAHAAFNICQQHGYEFHILLTRHHDIDSIYQAMLGKQFDGALVLNEELTAEVVEALDKSRFPIVFVDRKYCGEKISSVVFDSYHGGEVAARYLAELGAKKIGFMHGFKDNFDNNERYRAYRHVLSEFSLPYLPEYELVGFYEEEAAMAAMNDFLRSRIPLPDAFFVANDYMAIGCIKALQENNINIPEDVSIIGYDDIELARYFVPSLTTINSPANELGRKAVEILLGMVNGDAAGDIYTINGSLVVRSSCKRVNIDKFNS